MRSRKLARVVVQVGEREVQSGGSWPFGVFNALHYSSDSPAIVVNALHSVRVLLAMSADPEAMSPSQFTIARSKLVKKRCTIVRAASP